MRHLGIDLGTAILGARAIGVDLAASDDAITVEPRELPGLDEYVARFTAAYRALRAVRPPRDAAPAR
jgi:hypothetical protein